MWRMWFTGERFEVGGEVGMFATPLIMLGFRPSAMEHGKPKRIFGTDVGYWFPAMHRKHSGKRATAITGLFIVKPVPVGASLTNRMFHR
jgi:hypothetical protein